MESDKGNKIRIVDIAERAGVSPGTVDRVLHNRGEVAQGTREYILKIVEQLGYQPNLLAKSLATKKIIKIAALIPDSGKDNPYWEKPGFGIKQAASELKDFNTQVNVYKFDLHSESSFLATFSNLLKDKPDGLVFTPIFYKAAFDIVKICEEQGIPFIFIDMKLEACNNLAYFGQNAEQSGFLAGKLLHYSLSPEADILVVKPKNREGSSHHLQWREKGFLSFFLSDSNTKGISCHSLETDLSHRKRLFKDLDDALSGYPQISGIFITNSRAFKVGQYLYERKIRNILLIGYDLLAENLDFLERGVIHFLIGQKPEEQGYKSIQAMFNHLVLDRQVDKTNYSPIDIIMKENIDYYKNYKF